MKFEPSLAGKWGDARISWLAVVTMSLSHAHWFSTRHRLRRVLEDFPLQVLWHCQDPHPTVPKHLTLHVDAIRPGKFVERQVRYQYAEVHSLQQCGPFALKRVPLGIELRYSMSARQVLHSLV